MSAFDPTDTYKIIMTGDFNEVEWDFQSNNIKSKTWKPLLYAGFNGDVKISNIIFSCSKSNGCWTKENGDRGGDYIFASGNPAKISVPSNYKFAPEGACGDIKQMKSIWQSDHLPVMAELS